MVSWSQRPYGTGVTIPTSLTLRIYANRLLSSSSIIRLLTSSLLLFSITLLTSSDLPLFLFALISVKMASTQGVPLVPLGSPPAMHDEESTIHYGSESSYVNDPKEARRRALAEIDNAKFGWHHVRAVVVAGVGFFTDSYDIFAINLCVSMLGVVYWQTAKSNPGKIPSSSDTAIKVATSGGTVIGQLFFGWLADRIGRKRMYGFELIIIILATLAQALSSDSRSISITGLLIFWRVVMGIGIGGDYPLSSIITSE